jgi:hypothetical protein
MTKFDCKGGRIGKVSEVEKEKCDELVQTHGSFPNDETRQVIVAILARMSSWKVARGIFQTNVSTVKKKANNPHQEGEVSPSLTLRCW